MRRGRKAACSARSRGVSATRRLCLCWRAAGAQRVGDLHPPHPAVSSQLWAHKEWQLVGYIKAGEPQPAQKKLLELLVFSFPPSLHVIQLPHNRGAEDKPL